MIKISLTDQMALRQYLSVSFMILVVVNRLCVCVYWISLVRVPKG